MSREQWGHGYWKGVKDAQTGKVSDKKQSEPFEAMVCRACYVLNCYCRWKMNYEPIDVSVARGLWTSQLWTVPPIPEQYHKDIYDYILEHPYVFGIYIAGEYGEPWTEDAFATSSKTEDETWNKWYKEIIENNKEGNTQCT